MYGGRGQLVRRRDQVILMVLLAACAEAPRDLTIHRPSTGPTPEMIVPDPDDDLSGLAHLPCSEGIDQCATDGPFLGKTCCTYGDNLVRRAGADWTDTIELAVDGDDLVACGSSGAVWARLDDLETLELTPFPPGSRCQHAVYGTPRIDESRMVWLSHSGDNTAPTTPRLSGYLLHADRSIDWVQDITGGDFLDVTLHDGRVYVAAGEDGVAIHEIESNGTLTLIGNLGPNRISETVAAADGYLYTGERGGDLAVVDISDPEGTAFQSLVPLAGRPRLVRVAGDRIAVALGSEGVQFLDRTDPAFPVVSGQMNLAGSIQHVSGDGEHIAVATWHEAALLDPSSLTVVGSQRDAQPHGRLLSVQWQGDFLITGDRQGIAVYEFRPGFVAADAHATPGSHFFGVHADSRVVSVRNRGPMNLVLSEVLLPDPAFSVNLDPMVIAPGDTLVFGLAHSGTSSGGMMSLSTNDPDGVQLPLFVSPLPSHGEVDRYEPGRVHLLYAMDLSTALPSRVLLDLDTVDESIWAIHDGAAIAGEFDTRLGLDIPIDNDLGLQDDVNFPAEFGGPRFIVIDKLSRVRAVRSHYDPEELGRLVSDLVDE